LDCLLPYLVMKVANRLNKVSEISYFEKRGYRYGLSGRNFLWQTFRKKEVKAITAVLNDISNEEIVEFGCGAGFYTRFLLAQGARHVWAIDLSRSMLGNLPVQDVTPVHGDACSVKLNRTFGTAICAGMLEFVPDPRAALGNIAEHIETGGHLIVLIPDNNLIGKFYRAYHRFYGTKVRLFDRWKFSELAADAGWQLVEIANGSPLSFACSFRRILEK
jgi:2-polyprenyl-3-methyl-5-hydroxy-6-metoxy-1,4-benzoquinol methylase